MLNDGFQIPQQLLYSSGHPGSMLPWATIASQRGRRAQQVAQVPFLTVARGLFSPLCFPSSVALVLSFLFLFSLLRLARYHSVGGLDWPVQ